MKLFEWFSNYKLQTKLIILFVLTGLLSIGLMIVVLLVITRNLLIHHSNQTLLIAASQMANNLDIFIKTNLDGVQTESQIPAIIDYLALPPSNRKNSPQEKIVKEVLTALKDKNPLLESYVLFDQRGINLLTIGIPDNELDIGNPDYLETPLASGMPYASSVRFDKNGTSIIYFSSPVYNDANELVGILRIKYNATILQQLVTQSNGLAGAGSFAVLLDENYIQLAHGKQESQIAQTIIPLEQSVIAELQAQKRLPNLSTNQLSTNLTGVAFALQHHASEPFFTAKLYPEANQADTVTIASLTTMPWLVAFSQPQPIFLMAITPQAKTIFTFITITILMIVIVAVVFSHYLSSPITRLVRFAQQVVDDDLTVHIPIKTADETGQLAELFNQLTLQQRNLTDNLEQRRLERQKVEEILASEDYLLRTLIDHLPDYIYVKDKNSRFLTANSAIAHHMGVDIPEDLIGKNDFDFYPEALAKQYYADEQALIKKGEALIAKEEPTIDPNGSERWLLTSKIPLYNHLGNLTGFVGIGRDITEQKRIEIELREYQDKLQHLVMDRTHQLDVIASLSEYLTGILDVEQLLKEVVNQIQAQFHYYHVHIYLLDDENRNLIMAEGTGEVGQIMKQRGHHIHLAASTSLVARAARSSKVVRVDDVRLSRDWLPNPLLPNTLAEMAVPIIRQNQVVGVLDVQTETIGSLDDGDATLLRSLANQVGVAIINARLFQQVQIILAETATLYSISQRLMTAKDFSEMITAVMTELALPFINRAVLIFYEYGEADNVTELVVLGNWHSGVGNKPIPVGTRYPGEIFANVALLFSLKPLFFYDVKHDKRLQDVVLALVKQQDVHTMAVLPLEGRTRRLGIFMLQGEIPHQFSNDEIRPYLAVSNQIAIAMENQYLFTEIQQRATELAQAKEAAELAREKSETANRVKTEFLSNVSHELRTPLNGILGSAQLMKTDEALSTNHKERVQTIQQNGQHLLTIINDILDISKLETRRLTLQPLEFSLPLLLKRLVNVFNIQAKQKQVQFNTVISTLPKEVWADAKRLRQILINLVGNAIKFTSVGGQVTLRISEIARHKNEGIVKPTQGRPRHVKEAAQIRFEVEDSGIGMTTEQMETIFQPFEQVNKQERQTVGTGLGLTICNSLVSAMGGNLQVKSEVGVGSTFWFEVPFLIIPETGLAFPVSINNDTLWQSDMLILPASQETPHPNLSDEFVLPPLEDLQTLYKLAQRGSVVKIKQWAKLVIEQEEKYQPFADQLFVLAHNFEGKKIIDLIEPHLN